MQRAAIVIGVDRTGDLPVLHDAARGAQRVAQWARSQGMDGKRLAVLTDENGGRVTIDAVKKAVDAMVDDDDRPDQLIVYFAGHGVNIGYAEYWLLSDAPRDSQAAVNVAGSEVLARYCGIPHVLLVSDACRTAADGIRAQRVTGGEIFPNENAVDLENPVDQFFACTLGRPALEVRDPNTSAKEFSALYTGALLHGLSGRESGLLTWCTDGDAQVGLVHPRPLKAWLSEQLTRRIAALHLQTQAIQVPDARIASDPQAWIARLRQDELPAPAPWFDAQEASVATRRGEAPAAAAAPTAATISAGLLRTALRTGPLQRRGADLARSLSLADGARTLEAALLTDAIEHTAAPFGPDHHETQCGFKIRGDRFVEAVSAAAQTELFSVPGDVVRVDPRTPRAANVLLVLESGCGVLLPALPQFLAALTMVDGELVDVAYEPSTNTPRWSDFQPRAGEIRELRSIASVSSRNGVFRLEGNEALEIARRMQLAKGLDPSLAVYASYAYNDMQRKDLLQQTSAAMRNDLGGRFFDIALHAGELDDRRAVDVPGLISLMPAMTQGWALLRAHRVSLPAPLEDLRAALRPSVWTLFDRSGVDRIRAAFQQGALP